MWHPHSEERIQKPTKPLLWVALLIPGAAAFLLGGGMVATDFFGSYYSYIPTLGNALSLLSEGLSILLEITESVILMSTVMFLGYICYKKGLVAVLPSFLKVALFNLGVRLCSTVAFVLLWVCGIHESSYDIWSQLLPLLLASLFDWLIYLLLLFLACLGYHIAGGLMGREEALAGRILYPKISAVFVAIYTVFRLISQIELATDAFKAGENFFLGCILPFVYPLIYSGLMFLAIFLIAEPIVRFYRGKR